MKNTDHFISKIRFTGFSNQEDKEKALQCIDQSLQKNGNFGVYGNLSVGLFHLLSEYSLMVYQKEKHYFVSISPLFQEGHDFSLNIHKRNGKLTEVIVGGVIPQDRDVA